MKSFYLTDAGKVRNHNEDSVIVVKNKNGDYLMAVADGMGGHSAGEVASSIAISYLGKSFNETFLNMEKVKAVNWLRESVLDINELIFSYVKDHPEVSLETERRPIKVSSKRHFSFELETKDGLNIDNNYDKGAINEMLNDLGEKAFDDSKNKNIK